MRRRSGKSDEIERDKFLPRGLTHWLNVLRESLGDALHKIPLLLEGILKSHISGLRVLER